jgi:2-polyprenyl-3-methyl-5-hydroxy-6-metoxy-1,4-benzoquinol methylase
MASESWIRTTTRPHCALCGQLGEPLYAGLKDQLFNAPGMWRLVKCPGRQCGLVWMNPMPLMEDLGKAYQNYYTHEGCMPESSRNFLKRAYEEMKSGYFNLRYGYPIEPEHSILSRLGWLFYAFPVRRGGLDSEVRYLHTCPGGRLLDVGCGSGDWLAKMCLLGWDARGLDFDAEAVAAATRRGLTVSLGPLEAMCYPDESFEAVTLNHVIEHLPDPFATLIECLRILKPKGDLILVTPNSDSLGRRLFKAAWRGLEPPRHLHLFSPRSIQASLERAGFSHFEVRTVPSGYLLLHSLGLWRHPTEPARQFSFMLKAVSYLLTWLELIMLLVRPETGECLVVRASKS